MFGIGLPELIIIFVVALFAIGPDKLPGVIKGLAKFIAEFKRTANHLKHQVEEEVHRMSDETGLDKTKQEMGSSLKEIRSAVQLFQSPKPASKLISTFIPPSSKTSDGSVNDRPQHTIASSETSTNPNVTPEKNHS